MGQTFVERFRTSAHILDADSKGGGILASKWYDARDMPPLIFSPLYTHRTSLVQ